MKSPCLQVFGLIYSTISLSGSETEENVCADFTGQYRHAEPRVGRSQAACKQRTCADG